jgi:phosphatidylserine decarboxylase
VTVGTYAFAQLLRVLPRTRITRAVGRLCELELPAGVSRLVVGAYVRAYQVDLDEAQPLNGRGAYENFDAFFTRRLRDGARNMGASDGALVSPADGRLDAMGTVERDGEIEVKGRRYSAAELLASDDEAERYRGGQFAVVYLSPRDYHRVHAPVGGTIAEVRSAPGELFPVNSISERHIPGFLQRNRRVAIAIDSESMGRVTVVMVAAMIVGRVSVTGIDARDVPIGTHRPPSGPATQLARGDELAIFHLGSTAVLFVEPGLVTPFDRPLGPVRLGDAMTPSSGTDSSGADSSGAEGEERDHHG